MKRRQETIIRRLPGATTATKNLEPALQIWGKCIDGQIVNIIANSVNGM